MTTLLIVLGISLGLSLVLTPLARAAAARVGLVDSPDGRRKTHARAIPLAGGIAILLSVGGALAFALLTPNPLSDQLDGQKASLLGLLLAGGVICAVGVADDLGCLRGRHKLLGQV